MSRPAPSTDTPVQDPSLLYRSKSAAQQAVCGWIRKTLHEVFLQALRRHWTISSDTHSVHVSDETLQDCFQVVQLVSLTWQDKLRDSQYSSVAEWVDTVYWESQDQLWMENTSNEVADTTPNDSSLSVATSPDTPTGPTRNQENPPSEDLSIPYCQLRRLGKKALHIDNLGNDTDAPEAQDSATIEALHCLQDMGARRQSYWPLDPNLIETAAREIPQRYRVDKTTNNQKDNGPAYRVVPRTARGDQPPQPSNDTEQPPGDHSNDSPADRETQDGQAHAILSEVLQRKRKNYTRNLTTNKRSKSSHAVVETVARPPLDVGSQLGGIIPEELSPAERQELNELVHPQMTDNTTLRGTLLGPLQPIGQIHAHLHGKETAERRRPRAYIHERLYPRRLEKNQNPERYRSRVWRTVQGDEQNTKYFFDLDLGWTLLEWEDDEGEKQLHAFSSLEVFLRDEDET